MGTRYGQCVNIPLTVYNIVPPVLLWARMSSLYNLSALTPDLFMNFTFSLQYPRYAH